MSKIIPYVLLIVAVVVIFFLLKGCGKGSDIKIIQDSVKVQIQRNDSIKAVAAILYKKVDSISDKNTKDSIRYTRKIDSFVRVTKDLKTSFLATRNEISVLHNRLETAFIDLDTVGVFRIADSLNRELVSANNQLFAWQISRDSTDNLKDEEIARLRGIIVDLQGQIVQLKALLIACNDNTDRLGKSASKAIKKAKIASLISKIGVGIALVVTAILIVHK
jgi:hypothetical protein